MYHQKMVEHQQITGFYKVNEKPVGTSDDINVVIDGWRNSKNVEYITYPTMLDIISK